LSLIFLSLIEFESGFFEFFLSRLRFDQSFDKSAI